MNNTRRPASLPEDVHLQKLKSFIATKIARITTGRRVEVEEYVFFDHWMCAGGCCSTEGEARIQRGSSSDPARIQLGSSADAAR